MMIFSTKSQLLLCVMWRLRPSWIQSQSEIETDKTSEVSLAEVVKRCVVTPRFPVEEKLEVERRQLAT